MRLVALKQLPAAHSDGIWAAAWTKGPEGQPWLVTAGSDESVRVWHGDDLQQKSSSTGHALGVVSLAAHPSAPLVASSSLDCTVRVVNVHSTATVASLEMPPAETWGLSFNTEGSTLAVAGGSSRSVALWSTDSWKKEASLQLPPAPSSSASASSKHRDGFVLSVAYSADGSLIACSSIDGSVAIFDAASGAFLHFLEGHHMPVRALCFSPSDPRLLITGCDDKQAKLFDARGKHLVSSFHGHASWVLSAAVSRDGSALITGSSDRTVRLWDLKMRSTVQVLKEHQDQVWGVALHESESGNTKLGRLATVSDDKSISLYDLS